MSENPEEWRSATDAASGRTYWYHRKTRVSTWVKPDFFEIRDPTPAPVVPQSAPSRRQEELSSKPSFNDFLVKISRDPASATRAELQKVSESLWEAKVREKEHAAVFISSLVRIVIQSCSEVSGGNSIDARRTALQGLFTLAQDKEFAGSHFYAHQSWTSMLDYASRWVDDPALRKAGAAQLRPDPESVLLLGALVGTLMVGPTFYLITAEATQRLVEQLQAVQELSMPACLDRLTAPAAGASVLDERTVQMFSLLAEKGHALPAVWLLTVFACALRSERHFVQLAQLGLLQAMQSLCTSTKLDQSHRDAARKHLLAAMAGSAYAREMILSALVDLGRDLGPVPVPMGPDPAIYTRLRMPRSEEVDGDADGLDDSDAEDPDVAVELADGETAAQARYRQIAAGGFYDVPVLPVRQLGGEGGDQEAEAEADEWNTFNRDVEWTPNSGTPWRLSSGLLWARCPVLRDIIGAFWDEGGGGLELSIDASDEVLACLCRYMHTGLLALPLRTSRQLQLLRVAMELGMESLFQSAAEALEQRLSMANVAMVIAFCVENGFEDLERASRAFLSSGGKSAAVAIRFQPSGDANPQSAQLRDAVLTSLQDVNAVLGQHPPSMAKLKVEPRVGTAAASPAALREPPRNSGFDSRSMLRDLDDQPDDSYDLAQLSLMDIAGGSALSRGNSYSADANSMYADCFDGGDYHDDREPEEEEYSFEQSDWRGIGGDKGRTPAYPTNAPAVGSAATSKGPKRVGSGGIYGLLLHGAEEATSQDTLAGGIVPTKSSKVPGRVVGDAKGAGTQRAAHKMPAPAESTPRTQRAASLLAAARPSDYAVNDDSFEDDYGGDGVADEGRSKYGQPTSLFPPRKAGAAGSRPGLEARAPSGPQEFVKQMSLAPPREMTPSEKRLERLSRPAKIASDSKKSDESLEEEGAEEPPATTLSASADLDVPVLHPSSAVSPKPAPTRPAGPARGSRTSAVADSEGNAPAYNSLPTGLVALKRSVSPSTTASQSSREGHLLSIGSTAPVSGLAVSPVPRGPGGELNVRGSLTLLKTKAASSRRRRSVADIEDGQQTAEDAAQPDTATRASSDLSSGRRLSPPEEPAVTVKPTATAPRSAPAPPPPRVALDLTGFLADEDGADGPEAESEVDQRGMLQCPDCSRKFNPGPYEKHVKICRDVFIKKRKAFDSAAMRIEGNPDLKEFVEHSGAGAKPAPGKKGKPALERKPSSKEQTTAPAAASQAGGSGSKWKDQSAAFRAAMQNARQVAAAVASGAPLPPPVISAPDPSLVQCQHCGRRFNEHAAERHIKVCQSIRAKPAALKRGGGGNASNGGGAAPPSSSKGNRGWQ